MIRGFCPLLFLLFGFLYANEWNSFDHYPPLDVPFHPVSTKNPKAQKAFDTGLTAIYAFNYDEAIRSFDEASQIDPTLAMAYWGLALALDENLDDEATAIHAMLTYTLMEKAASLSKSATPKEQAYIKALEKRFSPDKNADKRVLRKAYAKEMAKVVRSYPDDLDAATLYAESLMDLLYWDLWTKDKDPRKGALRIVTTLENVLKRNPWHLGANHYYIHALENSSDPQRALLAAYRLSSMQLPEWGHLIHTPSHIFMHVGDYEAAVIANQKALAADRAYIKKYGWYGYYPLKYFSHNLSFLIIALMWQEQYEEARSQAEVLQKVIQPFLSEVPLTQYNLLAPMQINLYFHKWEALLESQEPPPNEEIAIAFWQFARAVAFASLGKIEQAEEQQEKFIAQKKLVLEKKKNNNAFNQLLFLYADLSLKAEMARAKGALSERITYLKQAVEKQDDFFDFTWYYPICQTLGAALIEANQLKEAEAVFRKALIQAPKNGRLLFGLSQALKLQGKDDYSVTRECKEALRFSTKQLSLNDL
jgi:Flp pilus assembly protein TadD